MLVSLVMRRVINLIHQGTSPIVQEQNGLPLVARSVEIGEKSPILYAYHPRLVNGYNTITGRHRCIRLP